MVERVRGSRSRETEAIAEAFKYRQLWDAAASCLQHNMKKISPRGEDEKRMLSMAKNSLCGSFWSGKTNGWFEDEC